MRVRSPFGIVALILTLASFAGCGGGGGGTAPLPTQSQKPGPIPSPTPVPTPSGATESITQTISAPSGGTLSLPSGTTLAVAPGTLPTTTSVQLSAIPNTTATPVNAQLTTASAAINITFRLQNAVTGNSYKTARSTSSSAANPGFILTLPASYARNADQFALPVIRLYTAHGPLDFSTQPTHNSDGTWTVLIPATILQYIEAGPAGVLGYLAVDVFLSVFNNYAQGLLTPGLRYYDDTLHQWVTGTPPDVPVHPLLLLHGILSTVEGSYQPATVERLMADGGYDRVLGYDYNWLATADSVGDGIAYALRSLRYPYLDVMAHSYGCLVAMDIIPKLSPATVQVQNLILVEGPLNGALIQDPNVLASLIVGLSSDLLPATTTRDLAQGLSSYFQKHDSEWFSQFSTNSPAVQQIEANLMAPSNPLRPIRVIKVSGQPPTPPVVDKLLQYEQTAYSILNHGATLPTSDGVIASASEQLGIVDPTGRPKPTSLTSVDGATIVAPFQANHFSLVNNLQYIDTIGKTIHFSVSNGDPYNHGLLASDVAVTLQKGGPNPPTDTFGHVGEYYYIFGDPTSTFTFEPFSNPLIAMEGQAVAQEAASLTTLSTANELYQGLVANPTQLVTSTPTQTIYLDVVDVYGDVTAKVLTLEVYALPECAACIGASQATRQVLHAYKTRTLDVRRMPNHFSKYRFYQN